MGAVQPRIATMVLCTPTGQLLGQLPPFRAALPWWQEAQSLVGAVRDHYGVRVTVLRLLEAALPAPPGGEVTYLAELDDGLAGDLPLTPWDGVLERHPLRLPYAEAGGPVEVLAWAAAALSEHGLQQIGPPQQVRTWNLSGLWRIPVTGGSVWLKCVPPFFAHEGVVLARLQDGPVPRLLAHQGGKVLMSEIPGEDQYDAALPTLLVLVSMLVGLQEQWGGRVAELRALGLPDWTVPPLTEAIASVVRRTAPALLDGDRRRLDRLVDRLPERFASVEACGIPDSLVHGDFAPGNARGHDRDLVLLDWGDCGIGHPLLDQAAFMDRIPPAAVPEVHEHWNRLWRSAVPGCEPARAADLLAPVAAARLAVIYQAFLDQIEPSEHPYHRADPASWLTRAAALVGSSATGTST